MMDISTEKDIEKKFNSFIDKLKPYFEKYGYTYNKIYYRKHYFINSPEINVGVFRYGSEMEINHWSEYDFMLEFKTLRCTYLPNGKTSINTVNTKIRYNLNYKFDFETLEKWLESQRL